VDAFDQIIGLVLQNEGGYRDDPNDAGKATNYGISQAQYPSLDIKNLTVDQAKGIYKTDYYNVMGLSRLDSPAVQYYLLDTGVNAGQGTAVKLLQSAVHLTQDGVLGPATAQEVNTCDEHGLIDRLIELRMKHYVSLVIADPQHKLGDLLGWTNRTFITL